MPYAYISSRQTSGKGHAFLLFILRIGQQKSLQRVVETLFYPKKRQGVESLAQVSLKRTKRGYEYGIVAKSICCASI